jgi:DNA repair protein RadC
MWGHFRLKDLNKNQRPREKMVKIGVQNLSDFELLAIILRSGGRNISAIALSKQILEKFGDFGEIAKTELEDLVLFKNVGLAKATAIKAACEIGSRVCRSYRKEVKK